MGRRPSASILDGFPARWVRPNLFDQGLETYAKLPLDVIFSRTSPTSCRSTIMTSRLTCSTDGFRFQREIPPYDLRLRLPVGVGAELGVVADDTFEALSRRLAQYRELTFPVAQHYQ